MVIKLSIVLLGVTPGNGVFAQNYARIEASSQVLYQAQSTHIRIFLKTKIFFFVLAFRPHVNGVFEHLKRRFLKTLFRVDLNAGLSFSCGRTKTEVFSIENRLLVGLIVAIMYILIFVYNVVNFSFQQVTKDNT